MTGGAPLDRDVLISRIIDAEGTDAGGAAWAEFAQLAAKEPGAWKELADAQRRHGALAKAVSREIRAADSIDLPTHDHAGVSHASRLSLRVARWGGWAVAACLAGAWATTALNGQLASAPNSPAGTIQAGWTPTPQEALNAFLDAGQKTGQVVGQVPELVLLESNPSEDGKACELVVLRQIVERHLVPGVYRTAFDEGGRPVPVRSSIPARPGGSM
jgi:hypothetical protein